jgi:hypothetical protein
MNKKQTIHVWDLIEETMNELGYTNEMVVEVKKDVDDLIKANQIGYLLEQLPDEKKKQLGNKLKDVSEKDLNVEIVGKELKSYFSKDEISGANKKGALHILTEYTKHFASNIENKNIRIKFLKRFQSFSGKK